MFSSLSKIQKISISFIFLVALLLFAIGAILFSLIENKNIAIAIMITGSVMCVITSMLWITFLKWFSFKKERNI